MSTDVQPLGDPARALRQRFDEIMAPHRDALWRYCRSLTGSPWDAEDLVQETLLKAFARLSFTWQPTEARAYLFRMASNAWIDRWRRQRPTIPLDDAAALPIPAPGIDPLETRDALKQVVDRLPPRQRVVFLLTEAFGFAHADVATMLGLTPGAAMAENSLAEWLADPLPTRAVLGQVDGRELVVVVQRDGSGAEALAWVVEVATEEGRIARHRLYCFCPELLDEIGGKLGLPVRTRGYSYVATP